MLAKLEIRIQKPPTVEQEPFCLRRCDIPQFIASSIGGDVLEGMRKVGNIEAVWISPVDGSVWARAIIHDPLVVPRVLSGELWDCAMIHGDEKQLSTMHLFRRGISPGPRPLLVTFGSRM